MKNVILIALILINIILGALSYSMSKDMDNQAEELETFMQLGQKNFETQRCLRDLNANYPEGSLEYYESDAYFQYASSKDELESIKTRLFNKYGYHY